MVRIRRKNNIEEYGIFLDKSSPLPLVPFGAGLETPAGGTIEGILDANVPYDVLASVCAQNVKKRGAEAMSTFKLAMTHDLSWPNVEHYTELRRRELGTGEDEMTIAERVEYFSTGGYMPAYEIAAFSRVKDTDLMIMGLLMRYCDNWQNYEKGTLDLRKYARNLRLLELLVIMLSF